MRVRIGKFGAKEVSNSGIGLAVDKLSWELGVGVKVFWVPRYWKGVIVMYGYLGTFIKVRSDRRRRARLIIIIIYQIDNAANYLPR